MCRDCDYGNYRDMNNEVDIYELIDESLNKTCRDAIKLGYKEWYYNWLQDTASEYFDTSEWDDAEWSAWEEYIEALV